MQNKYVYLLIKDGFFRAMCILSLTGIIGSIVLTRIFFIQEEELKVVRAKEKVIAQLPTLRAQLIKIKGVVNGLTLNGIIQDDTQPMAIINNVLLKAGEEIEGHIVNSIGVNQVKLCTVGAVDQCVVLNLQQ